MLNDGGGIFHPHFTDSLCVSELPQCIPCHGSPWFPPRFLPRSPGLLPLHLWEGWFSQCESTKVTMQRENRKIIVGKAQNASESYRTSFGTARTKTAPSHHRSSGKRSGCQRWSLEDTSGESGCSRQCTRTAVPGSVSASAAHSQEVCLPVTPGVIPGV